MGTNVAEGGCIPDMEIFPGFNPAKMFGKYLSYVPDVGTKEGKGGYLFPKPRDCGASFNIHDPGENNLDHSNMPGLYLHLSSYLGWNIILLIFSRENFDWRDAS